MMLAATMLTAASCSDFNDYNETPADALPAGNQSLWQNISQNQDLSDFAALVEKTGFNTELDKSKSFTIWAPKNGSFDPAAFAGLSKEDLLQQFVKNHIAEYGHVASGALSKRIHTLNEKSYIFEGNGQYTFDGVTISKSNQPSNNGVMHIMDNYAPFYHNLYEYLKVAPDIDSLRNHFMRYELNMLDESASVKGPMVNGMQTYIDSVMVTTNQLTNQLRARISNEDSSYTFIMPTSEAFMKMYDKVKSYYNFVDETIVQDVANYTSATDTKTVTAKVNAAYLSDSLVRQSIVRNLIYSNHDAYNQWIVGEGQNTDSIRSTTSNKFSNPDDLLNKYLVGEPVTMSNGYARIVDSLAFLPWELYSPELKVNPRYSLANLFPASAVANRNQSVPDSLVKKVFGPDCYETNFRYMWITPGGDRAKPDFAIQLPGVRSTTYNFYVVFMPSAWKQFGNDPRPNWLNFELNYANAKGATAKYYFSKAYADSLLTGGTLPKVPTSVGTATAFTNNPEKTDTVFIGRFTFPVAYNGLGEYYPSIRVTSPISVFNATQLNSYSRDVRIAAILLRPVELDEYEAKQK